ncbi:MAG: hypothetical protein AAGA90_02720 [Actinomycetota bacterium]
MKKITGPALLAAVLLLAACGSDDSDADSTAEDITKAVEETTTTEASASTTAEALEDDVAEEAPDVGEETAADEGDEAEAEPSDVEDEPEPAPIDQLATTGDGFIVTNQLSPSTEEQIAEFQQPGPDGPIYMVNLLEFKEFAEYEDGRETDLTGREAYALYAEGMHDVLALFGAEIVFEGDVSFLSIGQVGELWDEVGIVRYPSRATLLEMSSSPEWMAVSVHRTAGLAGQLNIETVDIAVDG